MEGMQFEPDLLINYFDRNDLIGFLQGAVEEGIVIGGGCTFLGLADKVDHIKDTLENVEEKVSKTFVSFERFAYLWTAFFNCSLDYRLEQTS